MEYKFSGKITFDDYVQFNKFLLKKILFFKMLVFIFSLIIVSFFSGLFDFKNGFLFNSTTMIAVISFILLIYCIIKMIFSKKKYRKLFDSNKTIGEECNYIINEKNIMINSESGNSILGEDKIYKIIFDKDSIYIFLAANLARIIKKRFLENNEEYERLILFINENYKNKIMKK